MAIRNRVVWIAAPLLLTGCTVMHGVMDTTQCLFAGCATVGSYQAQCEKQHAAFPDVVTCLKTAVASDPNPRFMSEERKLYLLKAEQLSLQVQKGQISDLDARVALQQLYVDLSNQSSQQRTATEPQKKGMSFLCQDAVARGDRGGMSVHCQ